MSVWSFKIAKFSTKMILLSVNVARTWRTSSTSGGLSWPVTNQDDPWQDVTKTSTNTYLVFSSSVMNSTPPITPLHTCLTPTFPRNANTPPSVSSIFWLFVFFVSWRKLYLKKSNYVKKTHDIKFTKLQWCVCSRN